MCEGQNSILVLHSEPPPGGEKDEMFNLLLCLFSLFFNFLLSLAALMFLASLLHQEDK